MPTSDSEGYRPEISDVLFLARLEVGQAKLPTPEEVFNDLDRVQEAFERVGEKVLNSHGFRDLSLEADDPFKVLTGDTGLNVERFVTTNG